MMLESPPVALQHKTAVENDLHADPITEEDQIHQVRHNLEQRCCWHILFDRRFVWCDFRESA